MCPRRTPAHNAVHYAEGFKSAVETYDVEGFKHTSPWLDTATLTNVKRGMATSGAWVGESNVQKVLERWHPTDVRGRKGDGEFSVEGRGFWGDTVLCACVCVRHHSHVLVLEELFIRWTETAGGAETTRGAAPEDEKNTSVFLFCFFSPPPRNIARFPL